MLSSVAGLALSTFEWHVSNYSVKSSQTASVRGNEVNEMKTIFAVCTSVSWVGLICAGRFVSVDLLGELQKK